FLLLLLASLLLQNSSSAQTSSSLPEAPQPQSTPAQVPPPPVTAAAKPEDINLVGMPKRLLQDQQAIWTSPLRVRPRDAMWLVPFGAATGLLIGTDQHTMTESIHL